MLSILLKNVSLSIEKLEKWTITIPRDFDFTTSLYGETTQVVFSCSESAIEALEKGVKYVQINNKNTRKTSLTLFCFFLLLTLNTFHTFF